MKLALITPIPYLEESLKVTSTHMVLAHMLGDDTYYNFYKNLKSKQPESFIICDNSANEGFMYKDMELIELAKDVNADEIIAPDKYHDGLVTLQETKKFLDTYYEKHLKDKFSIMAVPQGKTIDEYLTCFFEFVKDPRINTIGVGYRCLIPAVADDIFAMGNDDLAENLKIKNIESLFSNLEDNCFNYTLSRLYFLVNLVNYKKIKYYKKKIHLLGLYNPYELKLINNALTKSQFQIVRSCDSAAPWQAAQAGVVFNKEYGVLTKPKAYLNFDQVLDPTQFDMFKQNLDLFCAWGKSKYE